MLENIELKKVWFEHFQRRIEKDLRRVSRFLQEDFVVVMASKSTLNNKENKELAYALRNVVIGEAWGYIPLVSFYLENGMEVEEFAFLYPYPNSWNEKKQGGCTEQGFYKFIDTVVKVAEQKCYLRVKRGNASLVFSDKREHDVGFVNIEAEQNPNYMSILAKGNELDRDYISQNVISKSTTNFGKHGLFLSGEIDYNSRKCGED